MQGLRPFVQDENSGVAAFQTRGGLNKLGGELGGGAVKPAAAALPGQRRALGNITNRGFDAENAPPAKTPAAAGPRRALGDITNAAPTHSRAGLQQRAAEKPPAAATAAVQPAVSRAEAYAEEGVERLAGKGWQQLEAEREARADAEMDQRLLAFAALGKRSLPTFFPLWGAAKVPAAAPLEGGLQRDALPLLPPSPRMPRQQPGALLDVSLDDVELPELNFGLNEDDIII